MKGVILVSSSVDKGTTFEVRIEVGIAPEEALKQLEQLNIKDEKRPLDQVSVLVADDNIVNITIIEKVLRKLGVKNIKVCENGQQAVDAYKKDPKQFSLCLFDCQMPVRTLFDDCVNNS